MKSAIHRITIFHQSGTLLLLVCLLLLQGNVFYVGDDLHNALRMGKVFFLMEARQIILPIVFMTMVAPLNLGGMSTPIFHDEFWIFH